MTLAGLLADPARLRVVAAVVLGAGTAEEVRSATGLPERDTRRALKRLVSGGLVRAGEAGRLVAAADAFQTAVREATVERRRGPTPEELGATPEQAGVLRNFVEGERLTQIPAQRSKRLAVLDFLAARFEPGRVYPERDVNCILRSWHGDYAALRRYLVDEGFLERREGFYWRAGGTFDVG